MILMELCEPIIHLERPFYGLSMTDFRRIAFQFAEANQINHPFNKDWKMEGKLVVIIRETLRKLPIT